MSDSTSDREAIARVIMAATSGSGTYLEGEYHQERERLERIADAILSILAQRGLSREAVEWRGRGCECSMADACAFARERDAAVARAEAAERALAYLDKHLCPMAISHPWIQAILDGARQALTGGSTQQRQGEGDLESYGEMEYRAAREAERLSKPDTDPT